MLHGNSIRKAAVTVALLLMAGAIVMTACNGAESPESTSSALNYAGGGNSSGNKPFNFVGWEVKDLTHINLYFDKEAGSTASSDVEPEQFSVKSSGGTELTSGGSFDSVNGTAGDGTTCSGMTKGTKVILTLGTAMTANDLVTVAISKYLADDNGLELSNYFSSSSTNPPGDDLTFKIRAPSSCSGTPSACTWSTAPGTPIYTRVNNDTSATVEPSTVIIFDQPIATTSKTTFLDALNDVNSPAFYYVSGGTNVPACKPYTGTVYCYAACTNDGGDSSVATQNKSTTFFYPETTQGSTSTAYNMKASTQFYLDVPSFTGASGSSVNPSSITFTTLDTTGTPPAQDVPGWMDTAPDVSAESGQISVTPVPTNLDGNKVGAINTGLGYGGYDIYYATSKEQPHYTKCGTGACTCNASSPPTCILTGNQDDEYFFRAVAHNNYGTTGYSPAANATIP